MTIILTTTGMKLNEAGYLLDTNAFIRFLEGQVSMTPIEKEILLYSKSSIYISVATFWEIAIKKASGKLDIIESLTLVYQVALEEKFIILPIELANLEYLVKLPSIHKDPFDRLTIAQALTYKLGVLTSDSLYEQYGV